MMRAAAAADAIVDVSVLAMAALLLAGAGFGVSVEACDGVPSMSLEDACRKACEYQPMYELCRTTLRNAPDAGEVTVYAVLAAKFAKLSYESTMEAAYQLLQNQTLAGDERAAYVACRDNYYAVARSLTVGAMNQLEECSFAQLRKEYADAVDAVEGCEKELWKFQESPLFDMNIGDRSAAMLASALGELVFAQQ